MTSAPPGLQAPFVRSDFGRLRAALVVKPSPALAGILPTHGESHAIGERALEQFAVFTNRLAAHGVEITVLESDVAAPLGALSADTAVFFDDGAFLMRPSDPKRRREIAAVEAALVAAHVPIVGRIEAPGLLDGGDVLLAGDVAYVGAPRMRRSEIGIPAAVHGNVLGREQIAAYVVTRNMRAEAVTMNSDVRRLRAVASLVDAQTLLYAPGVIDGSAFAGLRLLEAPRGEDYGAGVLALGPGRVLANVRFRKTIPLLRKAKIAVDAIDLWEFGKIGATPSLLTLALKRD